MKFYKEKENSNYYWHKNFYTNISYIYQAYSYIKFFKNGKEHNDKNASYYSLTSNFKSYYLNNKVLDLVMILINNHGANLLELLNYRLSYEFL